MSHVDREHAREKAEQVLECLTTILSSPGKLEKFSAALPLARICILLLGDHPTSVVASQILLIIGLTLNQSSSFNRKFELVSGWSILRSALPGAWDPSVHVAAFDILLGRSASDIHRSPQTLKPPKVSCPYILPAILSSLDRGLTDVASGGEIILNDNVGKCRNQPFLAHCLSKLQSVPTARGGMAIDSAMDVLVEELIDLHSSSSSFREIFKSQQSTSRLAAACRSFVNMVTGDSEVRRRTMRILEKVTHLMLMLALSDHVDAAHKQEVRSSFLSVSLSPTN